MKLVIISDTHGFHRSIKSADLPDGDVLIHCGDLTDHGELITVRDFAMWCRELLQKGRFKHILFTPGNHDFCFDITKQRFEPAARRLLEENGITYLHDTAFEITCDGVPVKFYGSPWCPNLSGWAFYDGNKDKFADAPLDVDVLITHSPAFGILDFCGPHVGSKFLSKYIRRTPILLHAHGHIHECHGVAGPFGENPLGYYAVNGAICTRAYEPTNKPIVLNLDVERQTVDVVA